MTRLVLGDAEQAASKALRDMAHVNRVLVAALMGTRESVVVDATFEAVGEAGLPVTVIIDDTRDGVRVTLSKASKEVRS